MTVLLIIVLALALSAVVLAIALGRVARSADEDLDHLLAERRRRRPPTTVFRQSYAGLPWAQSIALRNPSITRR
jgi:hypothetical protein